MDYTFADATAILARTPGVLAAQLQDVPDAWVRANEGPETFSPFDVVGHLVHGERADWIGRTQRILEHGPAKAFEPFDRFAMYEASRGKTLGDLLQEFATLRAQNLATLAGLKLSTADLDRRGTHPSLGEVTLRQLLATWVVHDQAHIAQVARVLAKQYAGEVGPWREYLKILRM